MPVDIQAALTVIGRRKIDQKIDQQTKDRMLDLTMNG